MRQPPWIAAAAAAALATIAILANLGGTFDFARTYFLPLFAKPLPRAIAITIVALLALVASFWAGRVIAPRRQVDESWIITEGQFFGRIYRFLVTARRSVKVVGLPKDWIFPLVISVFVARRRDVRIEVVCTDGKHERYGLLENLGCVVHRVEETPIVCVLSDPQEFLYCRAAVQCPQGHYQDVFGRFLYGPLDYFVIKACNDQSAVSPLTLPGDAPRYVPQVQPVDDELLIKRLANVRLYDGAKFEIGDVEIEKVVPVSTQILTYKLLQVDELLKLYQTNGWSYFKTCGITLKNGQVSLLVPPVLEEHSGKLCVVEGHTRLFRLREKGVSRASVVIVRSVAHPLPMKPSKWSRVSVVDDKTERRNAQLARYIETSTHKNIWV